MTQKMLALLGFAHKAGKVTAGDGVTGRMLRGKKLDLVIVASDSSIATKRKYENKCRYYGVPLLITGSKEELGSAIGRAPRAVLGVSDPGFARSILRVSEERV